MGGVSSISHFIRRVASEVVGLELQPAITFALLTPHLTNLS